MNKKWHVSLATILTSATIVGATISAPAYAASSVTLAETGSSLLYPLFNAQWVPAYHNLEPNINISSASTGSGAGISQAIAGLVQIGGSDAYMSDVQMAANPTIENIPLAISAQQVMYNLPGMKTTDHLKLNGPVLSQIFSGIIRYWDDKQIASLNKGVSLPHRQIVLIHRSDSSGDTFLFSQFLSTTDGSWSNNVGYGTSVAWPSVKGEVGAKGNSGIVQALHQYPYSISYVGISWLDQAVQQGIGYAALQNQSHKFVLPTTANINAAAKQMINNVPKDERISLIYAPGSNSYPIINFEYAIVNTKQPAGVAPALKKFLSWAISPMGGNSPEYLQPVHFLPLPASVEPLSSAQINRIGK